MGKKRNTTSLVLLLSPATYYVTYINLEKLNDQITKDMLVVMGNWIDKCQKSMFNLDFTCIWKIST